MAIPLCRHFGSCGGCDWQDVAYRDQLDRKARRLGELLRAALGDDVPAIDPPIGMRVDDTGWPWAFRHKASFVFGEAAGGKGSVIGHYAPHSRLVVPVTECPVHTGRANHIAFALHAHLEHARVPAAGPLLKGVLRHLILRTTRDEREAVAMLVVTRNDKSLRAPLRAFLATEDAPDGFYLNIHEKRSPYMAGRETMRLAGRSHVRETVAGASFLLSPTAFFQTNVEAAEHLVHLVLDIIGDRASLKILDLYAGSGLFTMPLALLGHSVTAVEESAHAMKDADGNLRLNRIPSARVRLLAARVEDALSRLRHEAFDLAILDPPRDGASPAARREIFGRLRPPHVAYVSCNPDALAAELPGIVKAGYAVRRIQPVDMFPHTTHVETVVALERAR